MLDSDGNITTVVIGVGGVLGAGQKDVAVPFKDLKVSSRDGKDWPVLDQTKDDLKNAPAYDKKSETKNVRAMHAWRSIGTEWSQRPLTRQCSAGCGAFRMEAMMDWNRIEGNWRILKFVPSDTAPTGMSSFHKTIPKVLHPFLVKDKLRVSGNV